ncbi:MAG TPA: hypothetical protein VJ063_18145 [Verrucomicrobiae bacterium]|nr:hypothetical protein [Verrucomicrobiae bacterium]
MIRLTHLWPRQSATVAAPFSPALERVREMRQDAHWEPITAPNQIHERADRISQVREHVKIPRLTTEREIGIPGLHPFREWLFLRGPVIVGIAVLLTILLVLIAMLLTG